MLSNSNDKNEDDIENHIRRVFGEGYALRGSSSLKQIGLHEFPVNATHKIMKFEVQKAVMEHLE